MIDTRTCAAIAVGLLVLAAGCREPTHDERSWRLASGLPAHAEVYTVTARGAGIVLEEIRDTIATAEADMFAARDSGAIGTLNREAAGDYFTVENRDLYRCVLLALDYAEASDGAFDPTVGPLLRLYEAAAEQGRPPGAAAIEAARGAVGWQKVAFAEELRAFRFRVRGMELDLGGVAKGFALDAAARRFARPGCLGGLIRIGGNAYAWGEAPGGGDWEVRLPDPRSSSGELLRVTVTNRGVAVSGHPSRPGGPEENSGPRRILLDPRTGRPAASDLIAAVAIADSAADADALSTALFVSGSMRGTELLQRMRRSEAVLFVRGEGKPRLLASASLRGRITLSAAVAEESEGEIRYLLPPQHL